MKRVNLGEFKLYELSDEEKQEEKLKEDYVKQFLPEGMQIKNIQQDDDHAKPYSFTYCREDEDKRMTQGYIQYTEYGIKLQILEQMKRNGIYNIQDRLKYSFETYQTNEKWQETVKQLSQDYVKSFNKHSWLAITGISGSGKSHISTSIIFGLASKGIKTDYVSWVSFMSSLKNDLDNAGSNVHYLKTRQVLYIDDFLKTTKDNEEPSNYDLGVARDVIWYRHDNGLPTILSSEYDFETTVNRWNKGLAYRIIENTGKYLIAIGNDDKRNFRKHGEY